MELTTYITNLVSLIGLGIAIDYSLLDGLSLPGGAGRDRFPERQRSSATMETAGPCGRVRGNRRRDRALAAPVHAASVHARFRRRRPDDPGRSPWSAALTLLPVLLIYLAAIGSTASGSVPKRWLDRRADDRDADSGCGWPARSCAGPLPVRDRHDGTAPADGVTGARARGGPRVERGHPAEARGDPGPRRARRRPIGAGCDRAVDDRHRHRRPGKAQPRPETDAAVARLTKGLLADPQVARVDFIPASTAVRRQDRTVPQARGRSGRSDYGTPASLKFVRRLRSDIIPAAELPDRDAGLGGRRAARRQGLPRPRLRMVPVARPGGARPRRTCCSCGRSGRSCSR